MLDTTQLDAALRSGGVAATLDQLAQHFQAQQQWHELFDTRLMQARQKLGLTIAGGGTLDELPSGQREQLEQGYLAACTEIGNQLLELGRLREAWMYLRPTGETARVAAAMEQIEVDDDNADELIELALSERIAPVYGYRLVLEHHGTCNAITIYDSEFPRCSMADQRAAAELLIEHLHRELYNNLRAEIQRREGQLPTATTITALLPEREWLFTDNNYHIDTTHLNSAVRIGRVAETPRALQQLVELCDYGQQLAKQFQFESDPPFENTYPSARLYYAAQLNQEPDAAVKFFKERAEQADPLVIGTGPAEVYIVLLQRLKRWPAALSECARFLPPGTRTGGFAPSLLELSRQARNFTLLKQISQERGDLLNYAVALAAENETLATPCS